MYSTTLTNLTRQKVYPQFIHHAFGNKLTTITNRSHRPSYAFFASEFTTTTTMSSPTIKTRILIISDTHNAPLSSKEHGDPTPPFKSPLPSADLLIHCGDLTMTGELHEYHKTLDMLAEIDAPV
jgi:predicted MPP superfamily phosphohydrolase